MTSCIGIVGYGMVGKAVKRGFEFIESIIVDPQYTSTTIRQLCKAKPLAIFVCVPTPTDDTNYSNLLGVLAEIKGTGYEGHVIVKSTVLPHYIEPYDVVYNPEFLSRATSYQDFVRPPILVIGANTKEQAESVKHLYVCYSDVRTDNIMLTDIKTAALVKYTFNSFYATKITFMNEIYDVAQKMGVNYNGLVEILEKQPWMGTHHFRVPGPDGKRGYGGPCLPKDLVAFAREYNITLLKGVHELNKRFRTK